MSFPQLPCLLAVSNDERLATWLGDENSLWQYRQLSSPASYQQIEHVHTNHRIGLLLLDVSPFDNSEKQALASLLQRLPGGLPIIAIATDTPNGDLLCQLVNACNLQRLLCSPWSKDDLLNHIQDVWPRAVTRDERQKQWLEKRLAKHVSHMRSNFFDYTSMSDTELSTRLINALYDFFKDNDEEHLCRTYSAKHVLTREGDANDLLWFITKGEVVLKKQQEEDLRIVAHMGEGTLVGGMSFVTGEPAFTTGITTMSTDVIKLDRNTFSRVLDSSSDLLPLFVNLLLRLFNRRLQKSIQTEQALQSTLNSLANAQQQLIDQEKMAVLGQLIAGVAHELNNPVAAIMRGSDTIAQQVPELLTHEQSASVKALGCDILSKALTVQPLSTTEIRQRSKLIAKHFSNSNDAKKVVTMGLDKSQVWDLYGKSLSQNPEQLSQLERYHQVGNFLRNIQVCSQRIAGLVKGLKHYASQDPEQPIEANLNEGIAETMVIMENRLKQFEVSHEYGELPLYHGYPIALQQVWTNIIGNALDAMEKGGKLSVSSEYQAEPSPQIVITISDNGPGIPHDLQQKIFELNFTTKREGNFGLGIGLSVCQQIVNKHGGKISLTSAPGQTEFSISLPLNTALH